MIVVSVLYPKTGDSHFDYEYYLEKHMPLVRSRWTPMGLVSDTLVRGAAALDSGPPSFELIGLLSFESEEKLQQALAAHGGEVMGDIPNFTNVSPVVQSNHPV